MCEYMCIATVLYVCLAHGQLYVCVLSLALCAEHSTKRFSLRKMRTGMQAVL